VFKGEADVLRIIAIRVFLFLSCFVSGGVKIKRGIGKRTQAI